MIEVLQKIKKSYTTILVAICAIICSVILLMNVVQCALRYLTDLSFHYTEDVTVFGMLWIMGFGVSIGWMNREHLLINVIDRFLKGRSMEILMFALDILGIAVGVAMMYFGRLSQAMNTGFVMSVIGVDESFRYWPLIVGGGLNVFACIVCVLEQILVWRKEGKKE